MAETQENPVFVDAWNGGVVDMLIGVPAPPAERKKALQRFGGMWLDKESREEFSFPAQYMFKDVPRHENLDDPVAFLVNEMDRFNIRLGMINVATNSEARRAIREYPDRFIPSWDIDPNKGMEGVRALEASVHEYGVRSAQCFPAGLTPQVPINDAKFYPIYAKCVELDIPICVCAGVPGPRVPFAPQYVGLIDDVCWYFPELKFVTRHGCEPWTALAAKLMLKWPNLYYSTSAFAPRYYPQAIVDFANSRGGDKIIYAGYFPMGLSIERIMREMPSVGFNDDVWPKFLRGNAAKVLKLEA